MRQAVLGRCLLALILSINFAAHADSAAELFEKFRKQATERAYSLLASAARVEDGKLFNSINPLHKDRRQILADLDKVMLQVAESIGQTEMRDLKKKSDGLRRDILRLESEIGRYRQARIGAPETRAWDSLAVTSKADYDRKIQADEQRIADHKRDLDSIRQEMTNALKRIGLNFNKNQVDALLFTVTGGNDVQLISVYQNITLLTALLKAQMEASNDTASAKRYFATHCLLLRTLIALHVEYRRQIDENYNPKLRQILSEVEKLEQESNRKIDAIDKSGVNDPMQNQNRNIYTMTLLDLELTKKVAIQYQALLSANKERVNRALSGLEPRYDAAEQLYRTVTVASQLLSLMSESSQLSGVLSLQVPDLAMFSSPEMGGKLLKLTDRLSTRD